jgi:cobalt/nickel transport protein
MRRRHTTFLLLLGIIALVAIALVLGRGADTDEKAFVGTDSRATSLVEQNHPHYVAWFQPLFRPQSPEVESGLFALQAALGGAAVGYAVAALRGRRRLEAALAAAREEAR